MGTFIYRIPPCPYYDTKTMELWLEEMAAKGLILGKEGIFPGIVAFEKAQPQSIRYRLIASEHPPKQSRAFRYAPVPEEKIQSFHREFGWEYIATRREFHIYACADPNAPEMETDPQVQAMAYDSAIRREKLDMLCYALLVAVNILLLGWQFYDLLMGNSTRFRTYHGWMGLMWLFYLVPHIRGYRQLRLRQKGLREGQPLPASPGYRKTAPIYWLGFAGKMLLLAAFFAAVLNSPPSIYPRQDWIPLSEYTGEIPFATMEDLLPEAQLREDIAWNNHILTVSNPLADTWQLSQQLHITLPDGTKTSGTLTVLRRNTKIPSLARRQAQQAFSHAQRREETPVMLSIDGIDYGFYCAERTYDYVVLCKGNLFLSADFKIYNADPITPEQLARIMTASVQP